MGKSGVTRGTQGVTQGKKRGRNGHHEGESEEVNEEIAVEIEGMETMDEADDKDNNSVGSGEDEEIKEAHGSWRR